MEVVVIVMKANQKMRKVIFLHVPKTGGTAFDDRLSTLFDNPAPRLSWSEARDKDIAYWQHYDYIAGHYPLSFIDLFKDAGVEVVTVMLFRDPVARVLSHWAYVHARGYWRDKAFTKWVKEVTFDEWLLSVKTHAPANLQTKFLYDRQSVADTGLERLALIDVVGVQSRLDGLQDAMDMVCGIVHKPSPQISNVANVTYGMPLYQLAPETLSTIQAMNAIDAALYEVVIDIIDKRVLLAEVD